jgi:hypothetical protein
MLLNYYESSATEIIKGVQKLALLFAVIFGGQTGFNQNIGNRLE